MDGHAILQVPLSLTILRVYTFLLLTKLNSPVRQADITTLLKTIGIPLLYKMLKILNSNSKIKVYIQNVTSFQDGSEAAVKRPSKMLARHRQLPFLFHCCVVVNNLKTFILGNCSCHYYFLSGFLPEMY